MKASEILRKAAEKIAQMQTASEAEGCCMIIDAVFGYSRHGAAKDRAENYLKSLFENDRAFWFGMPWLPWPGGVNTEAQNHRIIALLLTADMAESVGD